MALGTRTILLRDFVQQHVGAVSMKFTPQIPIGDEGQILLSKTYTFFTDQLTVVDEVTKSFELPTHPDFTIRYLWEFPSTPGRVSSGYFDLEAGTDPIPLDQLIGSGSQPADNLRTYVDAQIAAALAPVNLQIPKVYAAFLIQDGTASAPVPTVFYNTLGEITFTYTAAGVYQVNSPEFAPDDLSRYPKDFGFLANVIGTNGSIMWTGGWSGIVHSGEGVGFLQVFFQDLPSGFNPVQDPTATDGWGGLFVLYVYQNTDDPE